MDAQSVQVDEVIIDEANQRGAEHNKKVWDGKLVEAGFEPIVTRALSRFTIAMHTRTLPTSERERFKAWAEDNDAVRHIEDDHDGAIYFVTI